MVGGLDARDDVTVYVNPTDKSKSRLGGVFNLWLTPVLLCLENVVILVAAGFLWTMDKPYQFLGDGGGMGIGYCASAAAGAALANRKHGRLTINIQSDGDFMYAPGVLWTAASGSALAR